MKGNQKIRSLQGRTGERNTRWRQAGASILCLYGLPANASDALIP